jgi:hypothetical protein
VQPPSSLASSGPATPSTPNGSRLTAGAPTTLNKPLKPVTPAALSFAVKPTSAGNSLEPSLPPIHRRRTTLPLDHAASLLQATPRSETTDSRVGPAILALLLFLGAVILGQALALQDANQQLLHQRHVAPMIR